MRDGAVGAEIRGRDLTEERLVVEGLGLRADDAGPDHGGSRAMS